MSLEMQNLFEGLKGTLLVSPVRTNSQGDNKREASDKSHMVR